MSADAWSFLELAALAEDGLMPIGGGTLDQAASFLAALRFYRADVAAWKKEQRKRHA